MFLEDRLRNIYIRSITLVNQLKYVPRPARLSFAEVAVLGGYIYYILLTFQTNMCTTRCGTSPSDLHLIVPLIQSVVPPKEFQVDMLLEEGEWWLLLEVSQVIL